jgi:hypothetical protein
MVSDNRYICNDFTYYKSCNGSRNPHTGINFQGNQRSGQDKSGTRAGQSFRGINENTGSLRDIFRVDIDPEKQEDIVESRKERKQAANKYGRAGLWIGGITGGFMGLTGATAVKTVALAKEVSKNADKTPGMEHIIKSALKKHKLLAFTEFALGGIIGAIAGKYAVINELMANEYNSEYLPRTVMTGIIQGGTFGMVTAAIAGKIAEIHTGKGLAGK